MEVLFHINRGWYPAGLTEGFQHELRDFQRDIEVLMNGEWHRAALVTVYSTAIGGSKPIDNDRCMLNVEGRGVSHMSWRHLKDTSRFYTPRIHSFNSPGFNNKESWDEAIDANPLDWELRMVYADWLEEAGYTSLIQGQRYQIEYQKTPGPACVMESAWHEATWFTEKCINTSWHCSGGATIIKREWCLPAHLFAALKNYILQRRDGGSHNAFAKSWNSRREAEIDLAELIIRL